MKQTKYILAVLAVATSMIGCGGYPSNATSMSVGHMTESEKPEWFKETDRLKARAQQAHDKFERDLAEVKAMPEGPEKEAKMLALKEEAVETDRAADEYNASVERGWRIIERMNHMINEDRMARGIRDMGDAALQNAQSFQRPTPKFEPDLPNGDILNPIHVQVDY